MRRRHLVTVAPVAGILALAGCGTLSQQQATELQQLIAGAQSIETEMASTVPALLGAVHLSAEDVANVRTALAALVTTTTALSQVPTLTAGVSYVQAIESSLNVIVTVAATIPVIPEPYHTALVVAVLALPPLEQLAGLMIQQGTALAATIAAKAVKSAAAT